MSPAIPIVGKIFQTGRVSPEGATVFVALRLIGAKVLLWVADGVAVIPMKVVDGAGVSSPVFLESIKTLVSAMSVKILKKNDQYLGSCAAYH